MTAPALRLIRGGIPGWSPDQLAALDRIAAWRRSPRNQVFTLHGYAGTGKSTLLREVARNVGSVAFLAPTGRAAAVIRRKGCAAATTIDRAIYHHPFDWRCGRCEAPPCRDLCPHVRQEWLGKHIDPTSEAALSALIVLDEASMVGPDAAEDLLSLGRPILAVGDPGQLPPVNGAGVFALRKPDALLCEIHRQAAGDPIIALSAQIRAGRIPDLGRYGDTEVTRASPARLSEFDAVICGRNATRKQINREIRRELGFSGPRPQTGEKLLILRNRHEKALSNGDIVHVVETGAADGGFLPITVKTDDGRAVEIEAPLDALTRDDTADIGAHGDPVSWGYGLTCHKAQGSQWDNVLVADESWCFRENAARWLDFHAFMPMHNYIFTPTRALWPAGSVNSRIPPIPLTDEQGQPKLDKDGKPVTLTAAQWLDRYQPVEQMTWAPGLPEIIEGRLLYEGGWIERSGARCFNQYLAPSIAHRAAAQAGRWIEHVRHIYPDDAEHLFDWLAHRVQRLNEKINHALVLGGDQGIGKDTLLEPVKRAIGPWNFREASPAQLLGRFNGFLKAVILRVSEARDLGEFDRFQFYDHMKVYTAAPPDVLTVDEKHTREYAIVNCCGIVVTTNYKMDGIYLPDLRRGLLAVLMGLVRCRRLRPRRRLARRARPD
jgi:hypothetical protein